ncbi:MAG: hypothetical protein ABI949_08280, partial [Ilumatobacteraceae bacterium]
MEPAVEDPPEFDNRSSRRTKFLAVVALVAIVGYAVTRPSNEPSFQPVGDPVTLPEAGHLTDLSEAQFEGVLVGLRGTPVIVNI